MMRYEYINSLPQFGDTWNTLLLSDDTGSFPEQRIDKFFEGHPSDETLQAAAQADYDLCVAQYQAVING